MWLTRDSALFAVSIPLHIFTNLLHRRSRQGSSPTVTFTPAPRPPFWNRSPMLQSRPTPYWSPATRAPVSPLPPSSESAPAAATLPDDHRAETRPPGDPAGRGSLSDIPQGDGNGAEPWPARKITMAEALTKDVRDARASEPETSWCCMRKKSPYRKAKEPRPRVSRSSGSMSRPWGLQPPPGIPY